MNRSYRLIWSQVSNGWVAVSETSRGRGKGSRRKLAAAAAALALSAALAQAAPVDGQVLTGTGSITQSGATTTVNQATQSLSLTWKSFNIAANETVNFLQPLASAIAVNRIFDTSGTQILGRLNANGQVYLINPNGILFGQGAQVNVGALVASTLGVDDASLNGSSKTFSGTGTGSIVNQGTINATGTGGSGGYVALLGNTVSNQGAITAPQGTVALGAGMSTTLTFQNSSLVKMQVDQSVLNTLADNGGLIRADGGLVLMSAGAKDALLASVVNNTGVIEARTVENHGGTILLLGGMKAGSVSVGGTLDASASNGGNGGFIETSAAHVKIANDVKVTSAAAKGKTGTWLIDPVDFTIAAGSDALTTSGIGASTLSNSLGSSNVSIATSADTAGSGDIFVNSAVSWAANLLTLSAHRNINISANLNATSTASLALLFGQGAAASGNTSKITTTGAAVNLPAGTTNFTTRQGSNGAVKNYTVITSLGAEGSTTATDLQGMGSGPTTHYALGSDIDATATSGWNAGSGFAPIGNAGAPFVGTFDGLGHTVSALTIDRPAAANTGLFGYASTGSLIQNVGLVGGGVTGAAGTGALVGSNTTGTVNNSYTTGNVTGAAGTGGLVGSITTGNISNSYATGAVIGAAGTGGLVGSITTGNITNSYATGSVNNGAAASIGGLLGSGTTGNVTHSYATGDVTGGAGAGGLVGDFTTGNIIKSYAAGAVFGGAGSGGLVGTITSGNITDTYATGSVKGDAGTGGLVGVGTTGIITNSYATGLITGTGAGRGGLIGSTSAAHVGSFWDVNGTGMTTSTGGTGVGMAIGQLKTQANFTSSTSANNNNNPAWDFSNTWLMYDGLSMPLLRSFLTPLTVSANNVIKTYDGAAYTGNSSVSYNSGVSYSSSSAPTTHLNGTLVYGGSAVGSSNAGSYAINLSGLHSNQQGYLINYVAGTLSVAPAPVSISGVRTYDGSTILAASIFNVSGVVTGQDLSLRGSGSLVDRNAGISKAGRLDTLTLRNGNVGLASNYTLVGGIGQVRALSALIGDGVRFRAPRPVSA